MSRIARLKALSATVAISHRWMVASRVLAAALGGYLLASLFTAVLALLLPLCSSATRAEGVMIAMMLSFSMYTVVVIWVFSVRSAGRAWRGVILSTALLGGLLLILMRGS